MLWFPNEASYCAEKIVNRYKYAPSFTWWGSKLWWIFSLDFRKWWRHVKTIYKHKNNCFEEVPEDLSWSDFFLIQDNVFQSLRTTFLLSFYVISLALKMFYFLSANHLNQEWRFVSCNGAMRIALVLHSVNCAALSQSESSNFFMYIITFLISIRYTALSTLDANHGTASRPRADPRPIIKLLDRH